MENFKVAWHVQNLVEHGHFIYIYINLLHSIVHHPAKFLANSWNQLEQLKRLRSEIPPAAPWLPILVIHIRYQVKTLHATHLLKLLYKMHKYEMDPTRTVEATERTQNAGWTRDGRTDGQTDGRSETNIPPPPTTSYNKEFEQKCLYSEIVQAYHGKF